MPMNPAFAQQSSRALPFSVGWNFLQGDLVDSIVDPYGQTVNVYFLGTGEYCGNYAFSVSGTGVLVPNLDLVGHTTPIYGPGLIGALQASYSIYENLSFHSGSFATIGLPNSVISVGTGQIPLATDQGTDNWMQAFPSSVPTQTFSGIAYYVAHATVTNPIELGSVASISPIGIWMTTRCRTFDSSGNVTGYGFTTNPTWHMIETLLRFQIKQGQPGLAGLTSAESACFDWPAMVAHAERNATILANGKQQFCSNFSWAADSTVAQMMEQQLRNCVSFRRIRGGKIQFIGEENRASVFTFSQRNMIPGTLKLTKKDLLNAPNVYVPRFRTLEIPAVTQVKNVVTTGPSTVLPSTFTTIGAQPFAAGNVFAYDGGINPSEFAGLYQMANGGAENSTNTGPEYPNIIVAQGGPNTSSSISCSGGYLGAPNSRFQQYAPNVVQHRAHQRSLGQVAPGINPLPKIIPVYHDLGNNTFDQTNRIEQYYCSQDLGTDGPDWLAPFIGTISGALEAVDINGAALLEVEVGDVVTLDSTAAPSNAGLYQVVDPLVTQFPFVSNGGSISGSQRDLSLQTYNPSAFTQVSANPGSSYQTLQASVNLLPMTDLMPSTPAWWCLQATPQASYDGSTGSVLIPDLTLMWQGQTAPTTYPAISIADIPVGGIITLYLVVTDIGTTPTLRVDTTNQYPPIPIPTGQMILLYGLFSQSSSFTGEFVSSGPIPAGQSLALPLIAGASIGLVFTPSASYFAGSTGTSSAPYLSAGS